MPEAKPLVFLASTTKDLAKLPADVQQALGEAFEALALGGEPSDFKPLTNVGAGVYEIRVRAKGNAYRAAYVARFDEALYVLHVWQKKTQQTARPDLDLIRSRYKMLVQQRE